MGQASSSNDEEDASPTAAAGQGRPRMTIVRREGSVVEAARGGHKKTALLVERRAAPQREWCARWD
jgi:hypothetical protein